MNKDQCVMVKTEVGKVSYCAITVDIVSSRLLEMKNGSMKQSIC